MACFLMILSAGIPLHPAQDPKYANAQILVEPAELAETLRDPALRILDVRPTPEYRQGHIPGAISLPAPLTDDPTANLRGFPIEPERGQALFREAGVNGSSRVVIYDDQANRFAARVFYVLEFFGHKHVQVLNGGYKNWLGVGLATSTEVPSVEAGDFTAEPSPALIANSDWVQKHLNDPAVRLVDARSPEEFSGEVVQGARGGHIPGAVNIDWTRTLTPGEIKTILDPDELQKIFSDGHVMHNQEIVSYCQSGMRASEVYFVLRLMGYERVRVYDGSWQDWSADPNLQIEK